MPSILSIQSHVVHGYVGNRAATFPLQLLGWDVDAMNTVELSNHTGYGTFRGKRTPPEELENIYEGLKAIGFRYDALLTGYIPTAESINVVAGIGADLKKRFPQLIWLLDPVLGDEGKLYVSADSVIAYKKILEARCVTITTPNWFEVETLTGIKLNSVEDSLKAIAYFHNNYNIPYVVISSVAFKSSPGKLYSFGSTISKQPFVIEYEAIDSYFTGTGDFFGAILVDKLYQSLSQESLDYPLATALNEALTVMQKVLKITYDRAKRLNPEGSKIGDPNTMKNAELSVVQGRDAIVEPVEGRYEVKFL